ncbi:putative oxidoreductase [Trypanosoma theileri]|uniref:Putative oxidoreductase n=1 Tax=Trypanosoma theileri TaxID=67003 RepID=A0A1X0NZZ5_9TRYP|nr:putative oxidoreductase [Trypanosoma theileri]ORC90171.1 putative oxidoreductase [Trypanosoma theileri]
MKTIRAVTLKAFGGADMLQISRIPEVTLSRPNEVLIRVMAAGVNRGDISQRRGHYPPPKGSTEILGLEASGVVLQVGSDVKAFKEGDRVMALLTGGGYAEMVAAHEGSVMKIPEGYTFVEAAAIPEAFATAWQTLKFLGDVQKDQKVLIHAGASGVGSVAMQIVEKYFKATAIATCSPEKMEFCKRFASVVIDRTPDEAGYCFSSKLRNLVGDECINLVIDPVVGGRYLEEDGEVLAQDGRVVLLAYMGGTKVSLNIIPFFRKRATVLFTKLRDRTDEYKADLIGSLEKELLPYIRDRAIVPVVQRSFPLEEVAEAHSFIESNKSTGKVVLTVSGPDK